MSARLALAVVLLGAGSAMAAPIPEVSLEMAHCPSISRNEVGRVTAIELDAHVLDKPAVASHTTRVEIECEGTRVRLVVSDPLTGKQLMRSMELTAREEPVADRMLALAISELVITSWLELTMTPPSRSTPTAGPADPTASDLELRRAAQERAEKRAALPRRTGTGYALALGQTMGPFHGVGHQWGGGIRLGWISHLRWIDGESTEGRPALELDFAATWGDVDRAPLGRVHVSTLSTSPRVLFRIRRRMIWMDLGLGVRLGLARLVGSSADSGLMRESAGTWAGPAGYLGVGLQWRHLVVAAGVEVGHVTRSVTGVIGEAGAEAAIAGNWASGQVALGWGQ